jgi:hypothetical protein
VTQAVIGRIAGTRPDSPLAKVRPIRGAPITSNSSGGDAGEEERPGRVPTVAEPDGEGQEADGGDPGRPYRMEAAPGALLRHDRGLAEPA